MSKSLPREDEGCEDSDLWEGISRIPVSQWEQRLIRSSAGEY